MTYRDILRRLDDWFADGVAGAGDDVVLCRRGCAACCHGPFDISPADAELVAGAVNQLDPAVRTSVERRAAAQVAQYADRVATWHAPWDVEMLGERAFDGLADALAGVPCPALGDGDACLIYDSRPATCRMIGLPMRTAALAVLANDCPIIDTSAAYAALEPVPFDLQRFETDAEVCDLEAFERGWVTTTVAGAIAPTRPR